jgi:hypothetical protein
LRSATLHALYHPVLHLVPICQLFSEKFSEEDWEKKVATLNQALAGKAGKTIKAAVTIEAKNGAVQVETPGKSHARRQ